MDDKRSSKLEIGLSEVQEKYEALQREIRLLRDQRLQVARKLRKQMQLQTSRPRFRLRFLGWRKKQHAAAGS